MKRTIFGKLFPAFIILTATSFFTGLTYDTTHSIRFTSKGLDFFNAKKVSLKGNITGYTIAKINYADTLNPLITDLQLTFDKDFPFMIKDDAGHYSIRYAQYSYSPEAVKSEGFAHFFHRDHRVEIQTARNTWLTNCTDLGSFTIEAKIKLTKYSSNAVILSRVGYAAGKQGFEIVSIRNRIAVRFHRMFFKKNNTPVDVFLHRSPLLNLDTWYHIAVSFDRISGKLETIINGQVVETVFCTEEGEPFVDVLVPKFHCADMPVAVVGKNFHGSIDSVRITQRHFEDLQKTTEIAKTRFKGITYDDRVVINREGIISSPVYQFPDFGTKVTLFQWSERLEPSTYIWMEFRISDEYFTPDDALPQWYRISNRQRNIFLHKTNNEFLRGKYYQWRAYLIASPEGSHAPVLYDIGMEYALDTAPRPPVMVTVDSAGDTSITVKWKRNAEHDILGYNIYYGVKSKKYDGVIRTVNGRRITNEMSDNAGYIKVTVTNEIIEENRRNDPKGFMTYPVFKNKVLYFLAVTAYDTYKPDTMFNHESKHSKEISARPDPGTDIKAVSY